VDLTGYRIAQISPGDFFLPTEPFPLRLHFILSFTEILYDEALQSAAIAVIVGRMLSGALDDAGL
jgi:hypothetical protein